MQYLPCRPPRQAVWSLLPRQYFCRRWCRSRVQNHRLTSLWILPGPIPYSTEKIKGKKRQIQLYSSDHMHFQFLITKSITKIVIWPLVWTLMKRTNRTRSALEKYWFSSKIGTWDNDIPLRFVCQWSWKYNFSLCSLCAYIKNMCDTVRQTILVLTHGRLLWPLLNILTFLLFFFSSFFQNRSRILYNNCNYPVD